MVMHMDTLIEYQWSRQVSKVWDGLAAPSGLGMYVFVSK